MRGPSRLGFKGHADNLTLLAFGHGLDPSGAAFVLLDASEPLFSEALSPPSHLRLVLSKPFRDRLVCQALTGEENDLRANP